MDYPPTGGKHGLWVPFPWNFSWKGPWRAEGASVTPSQPSWAQLHLLETSHSLSRTPREPQLIPPLQLGAPAPLWFPDHSSGMFLCKWDSIAQRFPQQLHSRDPTTPQNKRIFYLRWKLFFFLVLGLIFLLKSCRKHNSCQANPKYFCSFPSRLCCRAPALLTPGLFLPPPIINIIRLSSRKATGSNSAWCCSVVPNPDLPQWLI